MKVIFLDTHIEQQYENFVQSFSTSMLYHTIAYKKMLLDLLDCEANYLVCFDEKSNIKGVLSLMSKIGSLGKVFNALPFYGSNGSILTVDAEARQKLIESYQEIIKSSVSSTIITSPFDINPKPNDILYDIQDYRIGQITFFENISNENDLMDSFHYKTRNMVRKAQKSNITIKIDNSHESVNYLYTTHLQNMTDIGGKPKMKRFFDIFPNYFQAGKDFNIYCASIDDVPIASLLLFYHKQTIEYYTPVVSHEYRDLQPLSLLIYQAMMEGIQKGFKTWNWGGTWESQEGVYRFKKRWGTTDINYYYYTQIHQQSLYYADKNTLLTEYESFFTLPFQYLK